MLGAILVHELLSFLLKLVELSTFFNLRINRKLSRGPMLSVAFFAVLVLVILAFAGTRDR